MCHYIANANVTHLNKIFQTAPDGPPVNVSVFSNASTSLVVEMCPPVNEKVNGIITNYTVFYSASNTSTVHKIITAIQGIETCSSTSIHGLQKFTSYYLKMAASTKIGMGPQTDNFTIVRTLEDGKIFRKSLSP